MPEPVDLNFVTSDVLGGTWLQWADSFTDVKDLVDQVLAELGPDGCLRRLVIAGHGADHTSGFFVFDPLTAGTEIIDGGFSKNPLGDNPNTGAQFDRLRGRWCADAIVEFRVCEAGTGKKGDVFVQTLADVIGVPVTAPTDSISALAAVGGLTTGWKTAYPAVTGLPIETSILRGDGLEVPLQPHDDGIAPVTRSTVTTTTTSTTTPPRRQPSWTVRGAIVGTAALLAVGATVLLRSEDPPAPASAATDTTVASAATSPSTTAETPETTAAALPNRPPMVTDLRSALAVPVTTYTVAATDPDGDALTYEWSMAGEPCGAPPVPWTASGPSVSWSHHEDEGCSHESVDHAVTLSLTVTDGRGGYVQCVVHGSATASYDPSEACLS